MERVPLEFTAAGGGINIFGAAFFRFREGELRVMGKYGGAGRKAAAVFLIIFIAAWLVPAAASAAGPVRVGDKAPQFEIQGFNSQKLAGKKNILLVFYRGHF